MIALSAWHQQCVQQLCLRTGTRRQMGRSCLFPFFQNVDQSSGCSRTSIALPLVSTTSLHWRPTARSTASAEATTDVLATVIRKNSHSLGFVSRSKFRHYFPCRPKEIEFFRGKDIEQIAAGSTCSFAVTRTGEAYAWGFGENLQLSTGEDVCAMLFIICWYLIRQFFRMQWFPL